MDVLISFLWVLLAGALSFGALAAIDPLIRLVQRRRAFRGGVVRPVHSWSPPPPSSWSLTLLVDVDEEQRLFRPSVQLRGSELPFGARLGLHVVDGHGLTRASSERLLSDGSLYAEVALPEFSAPDGATVEEVLGWHWDLVLRDWRGERQRWREHPAPAGTLNAEAELELPSVAV